MNRKIVNTVLNAGIAGAFLFFTLSGVGNAACTRNYPSVQFSPISGILGAGASKIYTVTIVNNDKEDTPGECGSSTFSLGINPAETNPGSFVVPSTLGSSSTGALGVGLKYTTTLTVTTAGTITEGHLLTTIVQAADSTNHSGKTGKGSAVTKASGSKGEGDLLKRDVEESCHGCHKTDRNRTPMDADWAEAIKNHNSAALGSNKWSASGGWGVAGGKYGEFRCTTCHTAHDTKNIFLIKETIMTPDGSNFSGRATNSVSVDFRVLSGTPADPGPQTAGIMGDDSVTHAASSFVCEVCHTYDASKASGVDKHGYNMSVTNTHSNAADCTLCHKHDKAFAGAGGCTTCHGDPPPPLAGQGGTSGTPTGSTTSGAHAYHATTMNYACDICHYNSVGLGGTHNNAKITLGFKNIFGTYAGASYDGQTAANYESSDSGTTVSKTGSKTCSVYCHGGTWTPNGGVENSAVWDRTAGYYSCSSMANGACHGASLMNPPSLGNHQVHAGSGGIPDTTGGMQIACTVCHADFSENGSKHVNGSADWKFDTTNYPWLTGTLYKGLSNGAATPVPSTYGQCSNLYCHSIVQTASGGPLTGALGEYKTPSWGGSIDLTSCVDCHAGGIAHYNPGNTTTITSGSHAQHLQYSFNLDGSNRWVFKCEVCHKYDLAQPLGNCNECHTRKVAKHANHSVDVAFDPTFGNGTYSGTPAPGDGFGSCSNTYCHSKGTGGTAHSGETRSVFANTSPNWDGSTACGSCHGEGGATGQPTYGNGSPKANSHAKHATDCSICHNATTTTGNTITNFANHVNRLYDLQAKTGYTLTYTYAATGGTCTNISCHGDGTGLWTGTTTGGTATWGSTAGCSACHGNSIYLSDYRIAAPIYGDASPKPNAHRPHTTVGSINAGETQCKHCHYDTTTDNTTAPNANHGNNAYTVVTTGNPANTYPGGDNVSTAVQVTMNYTFSTSPTKSTCSNVSCHPTGVGGVKPWNPWSDSDTTNFSCTDCHRIDLTANTAYHHSMNTAVYTPSATTYPTTVPQGDWSSGTNPASRTCLMCHVRHNVFSDRMNTSVGAQKRAMNLRTAITDTPTSTTGYTNTDYSAVTPYGICISCHNTTLTKDQTRQKQETVAPSTPAISGTDFSLAAHQYAVNMTTKTGGNTFTSNCSKCHDAQNGETAAFYTTNNFGTHDSPVRRLISALGITSPTDPLEQNFCYRCHSETNDTTPGGGPVKGTAKRDYYNTTGMTVASEDIWDVFQLTGSKHDVASATMTGRHNPNEFSTAATGWMPSTNRHIECEDCHDPHGAKKGRDLLSNQATDDGKATSAGTNVQLNDNTKNWPLNFWAGATVTIVDRTAGPALGEQRIVSGNTATQLSVSPNFSAATTTDNYYRVERNNIQDGGVVTTGGSGTTLTDANRNWVTNFWRGAIVTITSGTGSGSWRRVSSNTQTVLTLESNLTTDTTSNYRVEWVSRGDQGMVASATANSITVTGGGWIPDQWVGGKVIIINGTGNGQERSITTNSANVITVSSNWTTNPTNTSRFRVALPPVIGGVNASTWGVNISNGGTIGAPSVSYAKTATSSATYEVCLKCHSAFGWNATAPATPSLGPNGQAWTQTDIGKDFAPTNYAYHPIFQIGRNQPLKVTNQGSSYFNSAGTTGWPYFSTGNATVALNAKQVTISTTLPTTIGRGWWIIFGNATPTEGTAYTTGVYQIASRDDNTHVTLTTPAQSAYTNVVYRITQGLQSTFTDGWGPDSLMTCTDCHDTSSAQFARGPHGSASKWLWKRARGDVKTSVVNITGTAALVGTYFTNVGNTTTTPGTPEVPINFCTNCHRGDVYGRRGANDAGAAIGTGASTTYDSLSRLQHNNTISDGSCNVSDVTGGSATRWPIGCMNCHGGYEPGGIHGSSKGIGAAGGNEMGKRFSNGSSWNAHGLGDASGSITCYTNVNNTNLSTCSKHGSGSTYTPEYYYPWE